MKLDKTLTKLCDNAGLTLSGLAKKAKVPTQTLHVWTTGRTSINPDQVQAVANILKVSTHHLLFGEPDPYAFEAEEVLEEIFKGDVRVTLERIKKK